MLTSWMHANEIYPKAKNLTYSEFVSKLCTLEVISVGDLGRKGT